jgi:hypothetical protein
MAEPTFDIFSGMPGESAIWLEAVMGLANARHRMEQIAAKTPGKYFLFSIQSHAVIERIDTGKPLERALQRRKTGAA